MSLILCSVFHLKYVRSCARGQSCTSNYEHYLYYIINSLLFGTRSEIETQLVIHSNESLISEYTYHDNVPVT